MKNITVDMSGWLLGKWPSLLANALKTNTRVRDTGEVTVEIVVDETIFESAVRIIAKEAIELYVNDIFGVLRLGDNGYVSCDMIEDDDNPEIVGESLSDLTFEYTGGDIEEEDADIGRPIKPEKIERLTKLRSVYLEQVRQIDKFLGERLVEKR